MTIHARQWPDGHLTDIGNPRPRMYEDDVELDAMPTYKPGTLLMLDPMNPRRAIPHVALIAERARAECTAQLIDCEMRRGAAERLGLVKEAERLATEVERLKAEIEILRIKKEEVI